MRSRGRDERGSMVIEVTLIMGLVLVLVLGFANLVVNGILKGIVHSAVDQGVRAGARLDVDSSSACEARARQVMANILSGPSGAGASLSCGENGEMVMAEVSLDLPTWVPFIPDSTITVTAQARKETDR